MKTYAFVRYDNTTNKEYDRVSKFTQNEKEVFIRYFTTELLYSFLYQIGEARKTDKELLKKKYKNNYAEFVKQARRALLRTKFYKEALQAIEDLFNGKISSYKVSVISKDNEAFQILSIDD